MTRRVRTRGIARGVGAPRALLSKAAVAAAAVSLIAVSVANRPADARSMRVLFVGNSYTYYNNLPCLVSELAKSRGRTIAVTMIVEGGATLGQHWESEATRKAVQQGAWDAIVLQTQSTLGVTYLVDGVDRISDTSSLLPEARNFADAVKAAGTRVYLNAHWKRLLAPDRDQLAMDKAFADAARSLGATVIPTGLAWNFAQRGRDGKELYDADGSHPSPIGSYLAALTVYASLTGDDPAGLPATVSCQKVDDETEKLTDEMVTIRIDPALVPELQKAAAAAVREWGTSAMKPVPPIELPQLTAGEPLRPEDTQGTWVGGLGMYPRGLPWPAHLEVVFLSPTKVRVTVSFGGKPDDIVHEMPVVLSGNTIAFDDPQGPNKTAIKYRGVRRGQELAGIAELTGNPDLHAIGRWTLHRPK